MAAPAAAAVPALVSDLHHPGDPDLNDPVAVIALGADPWVDFPEVNHSLRTATQGFALWEDIPGAAANAAPAGSRVRQSWLDLFGFAVGRPTSWFREQSDVLLLSVRPRWWAEAQRMLCATGGLDLTAPSATAPSFIAKLTHSAISSHSDDPRLDLSDASFFRNQPRPASGFGNAAANRYFFSFEGEMLCGPNSATAAAVGMLKHCCRPTNISADRDVATSPFAKVLDGLRALTASRSAFFTGLVSSPTVLGSSDIAEVISETWLLLISGAPWMKMPERPTQRLMEIDLAARMALGSAEQRSAAYKELLPRLIETDDRIGSLIGAGSSSLAGPASLWDSGLVMSYWEQLAAVVCPSMAWDTSACFVAVSNELSGLASVVASVAALPMADRIPALRKHLAVSAAHPSGRFAAIAGTAGLVGSSDGQFTSGTAVAAVRSEAFLQGKARLAATLMIPDVSPLLVLDDLLQSGCKLLYMVGIRKLKKSAGHPEIEGCSRHLLKFDMYWAMSLGADCDGHIESRMQGKAFDESDVLALLSGKWHEVRWSRLSQQLDLWTEGTALDPSVSPISHSALCDSFSVIARTLDVLQIEVPSAVGAKAAVGSFASLSARLTKLERRRRKFAVGSALRLDHDRDLALGFLGCLKEAGERWVSQFAAPVDLASDLLQGFLTKSAFVLNFLDRKSAVGEQLFEYSETLSSLLGDQLSGHIETTAEIAGVGDLAADVNKLFDFGQNIKKPARPRQRPNEPESSDDEERERKNDSRKRNRDGKDKKKKEGNFIGVDAESLVLRHDASGKHHKAISKNTHITVGYDTAPLKALVTVYGKGLCPAALVSRQQGSRRLRVCDCSALKEHSSSSSAAHMLPAQSGPHHRSSWLKVLAWKP
jgi:hypothetical protein